MTNAPDKYTFKRRFLDGLPEHIIKEMVKRGAVPEYTNVTTMAITTINQIIVQTQLVILDQIEGHYASDPKCPNYGKPRLFAIEETSNETEIEHRSAQEEPEHHSEPDSSEGEYVLEEYEDYGGYINGQESDSKERFGMIFDSEYYDLLENCGPQVCIEENIDDSGFPTLELNSTGSHICDVLYSINGKEPLSPEAQKIDIPLHWSSRALT
ncbi:hypothetical protein L218DRAFT_949791 [Marasmius fiardii PR-910]|nr:hypothetical protein L218DRAFT_949791 [Marasmius fiardii PR-910]